MPILTRACFVTIGLVVLLISPAAAAVCPDSQDNNDQLLFQVYNCRPEFKAWFRLAFKLKRQHWDEDWGWDSCDSRLAFPRMMNAGYLLAYGLVDGRTGPWHSNKDYYTWASGLRHRFQYEPQNDTDGQAEAFDGSFRTDRVEMNCPSLYGWSAGQRAATMAHEATHVTYYRFSHQRNRPGTTLCSKSKCSDNWYFHWFMEYPYGQMEGHKHSMYQMDIEFLCDLKEFREPWVPVNLEILAGTWSNLLMDQFILDPPGWTCGDPKPIPIPLTRDVEGVLTTDRSR